MTNWNDLNVYNESGELIGTLGLLVRQNYGWLEHIAIDANGAIDQWQQHMLAAPGEEPDWNTPSAAVDWSGFMAAITATA